MGGGNWMSGRLKIRLRPGRKAALVANPNVPIVPHSECLQPRGYVSIVRQKFERPKPSYPWDCRPEPSLEHAQQRLPLAEAVHERQVGESNGPQFGPKQGQLVGGWDESGHGRVCDEIGNVDGYFFEIRE
jgi:hypothetical protein